MWLNDVDNCGRLMDLSLHKAFSVGVCVCVYCVYCVCVFVCVCVCVTVCVLVCAAVVCSYVGSDG